MALVLIFAALALTLIVELPVAALFSKKKRLLCAVALVNVLTNPLLNLFLYFSAAMNLISQSLVLILALEAMVVLAEAGLLVWARAGKRKEMLFLSLAMNACSFVAGLLIFGLPFNALA